MIGREYCTFTHFVPLIEHISLVQHVQSQSVASGKLSRSVSALAYSARSAGCVDALAPDRNIPYTSHAFILGLIVHRY